MRLSRREVSILRMRVKGLDEDEIAKQTERPLSNIKRALRRFYDEGLIEEK